MPVLAVLVAALVAALVAVVGGRLSERWVGESWVSIVKAGAGPEVGTGVGVEVGAGAGVGVAAGAGAGAAAVITEGSYLPDADSDPLAPLTRSLVRPWP